LRSGIYSTANLLSVGVNKQNAKPTAAFNSNTRVICAGKAVKFYDLSCKGEVSGRLWTFQGAQQTSSTAADPVVVYNTPGVYEVKLQVENNYGSDSKTESSYIKVLNEYGSESPNFEEGFENGDPISVSGFEHLSPTSRFDLTNKAGYTGSYSFRANINASTPAGAVFSFQTPSFDLSQLQSGFSPKFTFWASYAQPNADVTETLKIYISTDCGGTWEQIYLRNGSSLAYLNAPYSNGFTPTTSTQWRRHGLGSLSSLGYGDAKSAIFRIDVISGGGNPVYIDNINLSPFFASTENAILEPFSMEIYPNPATQKSNLTILNNKAINQAHIALYDITGRMISLIYKGALSQGKQEFEIKHPTNASSGVYYIRVNTNEGSASKRLIFENQ
jgi:PKD repeat protein